MWSLSRRERPVPHRRDLLEEVVAAAALESAALASESAVSESAVSGSVLAVLEVLESAAGFPAPRLEPCAECLHRMRQRRGGQTGWSRHRSVTTASPAPRTGWREWLFRSLKPVRRSGHSSAKTTARENRLLRHHSTTNRSWPAKSSHRQRTIADQVVRAATVTSTRRTPS